MYMYVSACVPRMYLCVLSEKVVEKDLKNDQHQASAISISARLDFAIDGARAKLILYIICVSIIGVYTNDRQPIDSQVILKNFDICITTDNLYRTEN